LDSLPKGVKDWPNAAVDFMYMLKAHCEAYQPTPEEIAEREAKFAKHHERVAREKAIKEAMELFKEKKLSNVIQLLEPYEASLSDTEKAKLMYCRKQLEKT